MIYMKKEDYFVYNIILLGPISSLKLLGIKSNMLNIFFHINL